MPSARDDQPTRRAAVRKARAPRAARACEECRLRKNKCDELYPSCTHCRKKNLECIYRGDDKTWRRFTPEYIKHLEEQVRRLSSLAEARHAVAQNEEHPPARAGGGEDSESVSTQRIAGGHTHPDGHPGGPCFRNTGHEVSGLNSHTRSVEYYGVSSSIALLSQVQKAGAVPWTPPETPADAGGFVSSLHNTAFSPGSPAAPVQARQGQSERARTRQLASPSQVRQYRRFLDSFFATIHYVHPVLDKTAFLEKCEIMWTDPLTTISNSSFAALCYSVLSLGALVGEREGPLLDNLTHIQWSRRLFAESKVIAQGLSIVTDLNMAQCFFFLAKVCQNELNPHWSYMYLGLAVRTALAMGINREPAADNQKIPDQLRAESRTWWAIYSLETEMSFAIGRPDTLGSDLFHNRSFPQVAESNDHLVPGQTHLEPPHCAIIKSMVDFSRITKAICLGLYLSQNTVTKTVSLAIEMETDLVSWKANLPGFIRPDDSWPPDTGSLKRAKEEQWTNRQRLVLSLRYHNLRMLLFGSLLLKLSLAERSSIDGCAEGIQKCLDSAQQTIGIIYDTYLHHRFFHTWFYNTTYTVFGASMILVYIRQEAIARTEMEALLKYVSKAIEILEAMDECLVATRAAKMLQRAVEQSQKDESAEERPGTEDCQDRPDVYAPLNDPGWAPLGNLIEGNFDVGFPFQFRDLDGESGFMMEFDDGTSLYNSHSC